MLVRIINKCQRMVIIRKIDVTEREVNNWPVSEETHTYIHHLQRGTQYFHSNNIFVDSESDAQTDPKTL